MKSNILWTAQDIIKAANTGPSWASRQITGLSMDSREVSAGDLFIALKGAQCDGHQFINEAFAQGAVAALVDHIPSSMTKDDRFFIVKDTYKALLNMAKFARLRTQARIGAVTGSVGKTSVKEMLALVLNGQAKTYATPKSFNNETGIPFSLAQLPEDAVYGIFEIGMNHPGEIEPLTKLVRPDVALITNVGPVHVGNFSSVEEIAFAKAEIFSGLSPEGIVVLNRDNAFYGALKDRALKAGLKNSLSFGTAEGCDFQLKAYEPLKNGTRVKASFQGQSLDYVMPVFGRHWALNSLGALATAAALGADVQAAAAKLTEVEIVNGRGRHHNVDYKNGQILVIDDSYNANPISVRAALEALSGLTLNGECRRIAVLGDMYELGSQEHTYHSKLADDIERLDIDLVYTCGPRMKSLFNALPAVKRGGHAEGPAEISSRVCEDVKPGDIITIKGSKGGGFHPRMLRVVQDLLALSSNKVNSVGVLK